MTAAPMPVDAVGPVEAALVAMQQEQIQLLQRLLERAKGDSA